jgi:beta-lactamase class C
MAAFHDPAALSAAIAAELDPARVPGAVVARWQADDQSIAVLAVGCDADGVALNPDSLFPVASISKLATALAVLRLADQGVLAVADPLAAHLPDAAAARANIRIGDLLCHTAGMPIDLPREEAPYAPGLDWPTLAHACLHCFPVRAAGEIVQYSNVGYGLLGILVEQLTNQPFAEALDRLVLAPLGIEATLGSEPPRPPARLADVRGRHAGTDLEPFNSPFWRSLAMPWAGLVTTASGALRLVRAFLGIPDDFLQPATRAQAIVSQTGALAGGFVPPLFWDSCPWGFGPDIRGAKQPHWAPAIAPNSFGHSGASGCLAWADPTTATAWAILGARAADNGWLVRRGPAISQLLLAA